MTTLQHIIIDILCALIFVATYPVAMEMYKEGKKVKNEYKKAKQ